MNVNDDIAYFTELGAPYQFVRESNRIEGITRLPSMEELKEFRRFVNLPKITVAELKNFVKVYQPDARLRDKAGLDVRVGRHVPPPGGLEIGEKLKGLLEADLDPYWRHIEYENLHPFTDGNGRSGRALWAWEMKRFPLGFLHAFYYQTLDRWWPHGTEPWQ